MKLFKIIHKVGSKEVVSISVDDGNVTAPEGCSVTVVQAGTAKEAERLWKASTPEVPPPAVTKEVADKHARTMENGLAKIQEEALMEDAVRSVRTLDDVLALTEEGERRLLFALLSYVRPKLVAEGKKEPGIHAPPPGLFKRPSTSHQ